MSLFRIFAFLCVVNVGLLSHSYAQDTTSILVFGDSIVAGYGLENKDTLTERMNTLLKAQSYPVTVINGGVSGDTTSGGRSRLEWALNEYKPDIVIIAIGGNDMLRGISPSITRENLDAMLMLLQQHKVTTILSAVQAPLNLGAQYSSQFNVIYPDLAKQYHIPLYPFLLKDVYGKQGLMQADGIHPNAKGAEVIAEELVAYLQKKGIVHKG